MTPWGRGSCVKAWPYKWYSENKWFLWKSSCRLPGTFQAQDDISPFSREWSLNDGWMATEWWRVRWFSVAFQSPFSDHSVNWMADIFQWPFSHLKKKNKSMSNSNPTLTVRPRGLLNQWMNIEYMCSICLNMYFEHLS